jgi:hypothetical protein
VTLRFLTEEWLAFRLRKLIGLSVARGADLRVQHVITDGPDGVVRYHDQICDGCLVDSALGAIEDPDFTLTRGWLVDLGLHRGDIDPYTAVVDGRVKVTGDEIRLLMLLPLLQDYSTELEEIARDLVAMTDD